MLRPSEWIRFGLVMFSVCTRLCFRGCSRQHRFWAWAGGSAYSDSGPKPATAASVRTGNIGAGKSVPVSFQHFLELVLLHMCVQDITNNPHFPCFCFEELYWVCCPKPKQFHQHPVHCSQLTYWTRERKQWVSSMFSVFTAEQPMKFVCFNRHWWTNGYLAASRRENEGKGRTNGHRDCLQAPTVRLHSCIPEFPFFHIGENPLCALPAWVFSGVYLFHLSKMELTAWVINVLALIN